MCWAISGCLFFKSQIIIAQGDRLQQCSRWHAEKSSVSSLSEYTNNDYNDDDYDDDDDNSSNNSNKNKTWTTTIGDTNEVKFVWMCLRLVFFVFRNYFLMTPNYWALLWQVVYWEHVHKKYRKNILCLELSCVLPSYRWYAKGESICILKCCDKSKDFKWAPYWKGVSQKTFTATETAVVWLS